MPLGTAVLTSKVYIGGTGGPALAGDPSSPCGDLKRRVFFSRGNRFCDDGEARVTEHNMLAMLRFRPGPLCS